MNETDAPAPSVVAEFHVEPHPDPTVRGLLDLIDELRREVARLRELIDGPVTKKEGH